MSLEYAALLMNIAAESRSTIVTKRGHFFAMLGRGDNTAAPLNELGDHTKRTFARYAVAAFFLVVAFSIRTALNPILGSHSPFVVVAPAALLTAYFSGLGPALVALIASLLLSDYFFDHQLAVGTMSAPAEIAQILVVFGTTLVGVLLIHSVQKSRQRVAESARQARAAADRAEARGVDLQHEIQRREHIETALREAKRELSHHARRLEERVTERTARLHQTIASLQDVLYHVAHDLRGPLRAMEGFSSVLLEKYGTRLGEEGQDYTRRIAEAAGRMDHLVKDLLDYGRVCHLELVPANVDLAEVLSGVLTKYHGQLRSSGASVNVQPPLPNVLADRRLLEQVLTHLVSNALKFVRTGQTPEVRIWAEELPQPNYERSRVRLYVEDRGPGIPAEQQERIFWLFERLRQERSDQSTGIGLAIVHKAMDRMHGFVGIDSTPGHGSTFWIDLPAAVLS